jgi:hypothetical protein
MTAISLPDDRQDPNQRQTNLPSVTDEHTPTYLSNFLAPLAHLLLPALDCVMALSPLPQFFLVTHFQNTPVRHLTMAYDSRRPLLLDAAGSSCA